MTARRPRTVALFAAAALFAATLLSPPPAAGQGGLNRAQRVALAGLNRDATRLGGLVRRGKTDDAATLLAEIDAALAALKKDAGDAVAGRTADSIAEKLAEARAALAPAGNESADPFEPAAASSPGPAAVAGETAMPRMTEPPAGGVSFADDVAPTLVNICGGCHMNGRSRGGFSMNTFEELMESGYVDPDDPEGGRMVRLMGGVEQPKMPPGNAMLKRSQWENARAWAVAGATLDRGNAKAPLRALVPTEAQLRRAAMAALDDDAFAAARLERAKELFVLGRPRETPQILEVPDDRSGGAGGLIFVGNVDAGRLEQLAGWAAEDAAAFAPLLAAASPDDPTLGGRGPLTVAVMKDRFDYEEFHLGVHKRPTPPGLTSDASVPADGSDAFVVLQDLRDDPTATDPGMRANLIAGLAAAAVQGVGGDPPAWLPAGLGLAAAKRSDPRNPALSNSEDVLAAALGRVRNADDLLKPGTFAPAELPAVGAAIVEALRANGGDRKLGEFAAAAAAAGPDDGGAAALRTVYRTGPAQLAAVLAAKARRR